MRTNRILRTLLSGLLATVLISTSATPAEALDLGPKATYLVRVTPAAKAAVESAVGKIGGKIDGRYNYVFDGFKITLPKLAFTLLSRIPNVLTIEEDKPVELLSPEFIESPTPSWGIDRIDQRGVVGGTGYTSSYGWKSGGSGATVYIADTGVSAHNDLTGRLSSSGYSSISDGNGFGDCNGHGTHVATTAAGQQYGVAKNASVVAVRVLDCAGSGSVSGVIAGLDWILSPLNPNPKTAAVVNMSLGGGASAALDGAVERLTNAGVAVVVAAGNANADACTVSPARAATAVTVGATDSTDAKASYSNWGTCVDINAPGTSITAGWYDTPNSTRTINGTSMATPHVTGAAAIFYGLNPTASVAQLTQSLNAQATVDALKGLKTGTPNRLLYVSPTDGAAPLALPTAALKSVAGITPESATVSYDVNAGGDDTTLQLQYSTDVTFTAGVKTVGLGTVTGYDPQAVSSTLTGLTPNTRYSVRVVGTNSKGSSTSAVSGFQTLPPPVIAPTASVTGVSDVTAYSAVLSGSVSAGNAVTQVRFQYSVDPAFATGVTTVAATPATTSGNTPTAVSLPITFLTGGRTYYVRLAATNSTATTVSAPFTFNTPVAPGVAPAVVTTKVAPLKNTGQVFMGTVHPQSQTTTVKFTYGTSSGLTTGATTVTLPDQITGDTVTPVTVTINGLTPGKGFYYRFEAVNASGSTKGNVEYAITSPIAPVVKNTYGNKQTTITAAFNVQGNAGGSNTRWSFEFTTDPDFKTGIRTVDATPFAVTSAVDTTMSATATGLTADTWYYFRAKVVAYTGPATGTPTYGPVTKIQTLKPTIVVTPSPTPTSTPAPTPTTSPTPIASPTPSPTPTPTPTPAPVVGKTAQTITFNALPSKEFGAGTPLVATASSKLPVTFSSATPSICQILDLGAGNFSVQTASGLADVDTATCTVTANQAGNATYAAATPVSQTFTWRRAAMRIWTGTFPALKVGGTGTLLGYLGLVDKNLMSGLYSLNAGLTVVSNSPAICTVTTATLWSSTNPYTRIELKGVASGSCSVTLSYGVTKRRAAVSTVVVGKVA